MTLALRCPTCEAEVGFADVKDNYTHTFLPDQVHVDKKGYLRCRFCGNIINKAIKLES